MVAHRPGVHLPDLAGEDHLVGTAVGGEADMVEAAAGLVTSSEKELAATMTETPSGLGDISEVMRKVKEKVIVYFVLDVLMVGALCCKLWTAMLSAT
jgi:hypothetical protein